MTGREDVSDWTLKKVNAQITHWKVDGYLKFCPFLKSLNRVLLHKKEGFFFSLDFVSVQFNEISVCALLSASIAKSQTMASQLAGVFNKFL